MARAIVEFNGKYACFSTVPDAFITPFMSKEDIQKWRIEEYGRQAGELDETWRMSIGEAFESIFINRTNQEGMDVLYEAGLTHSEVNELVRRNT